jgi:hypothetical protein
VFCKVQMSGSTAGPSFSHARRGGCVAMVGGRGVELGGARHPSKSESSGKCVELDESLHRVDALAASREHKAAGVVSSPRRQFYVTYDG